MSGAASTLALFRGHHSPHRVTTVTGPRPRIIAVLSYASTPNARLSGHVKQLSMAGLTDGVRQRRLLQQFPGRSGPAGCVRLRIGGSASRTAASPSTVMTGISSSASRDRGRGGLTIGTRACGCASYPGGPMSVRTEQSAGAAAIRPFTVEIPEAEIEALRARVAATRWPHKELVADASQGVQQAMLQELARYWATDYDWRKCEAELNALPQFKTDIDGLGIHFIHVRSRHENALPLIITHGWPGSVIEMLGVVGPLTDPTAHGGQAEDAFDLVIPSMPGYGFSDQPAEVGWDSGRIASAWAELMRRLGYSRYVAQGGDQGAGVTDALGRLAPEGLLGVHFNLLSAAPRELVMATFNIRLAFSMEDRAEAVKELGDGAWGRPVICWKVPVV